MATHRSTAGFSLGHLLLTAPPRVLGVHFSLRALGVFRDAHSCNDFRAAATSACSCIDSGCITAWARSNCTAQNISAQPAPGQQWLWFRHSWSEAFSLAFLMFLPLCPDIPSLSTASQCEGPYAYCTELQRTQLKVVSLLRNVKALSQLQ